MKLHILSPDSDGRIDGTIKAQILDRLPHQVATISECDIVVVPVSFFSDFRFNLKLNQVNKPWCCIDFLEYSTFWDGKDTHLLGKNLDAAKNLRDNPEWQRLNEWVRDNPPVMYLKRELLNKNRSERVQPISFLAYLEPRPVQSREEFNARPIDVFFAWGYSSSHRPRIHGDIVNAMATRGLGVLTHWDQVDGYFQHPHPAHTWVTIYSPWWVRRPIKDIMALQWRSKISISVMGAGSICFRTMESPHDCIMAMHEDDIAWPYDWVHEENCIRMPVGQEVESLERFSQYPDYLYEVYVAGQENLRRYQPQNYIREYLLPTIEAAL